MQAPPATASTRRVDPAEVAALLAQVEALAEVPVGPKLCAALAAVDGDRLPGLGLVALMEARHRQANHERGELLVAVGRILRHDVPGGPRMWKGPDGVAVDQVRASLRLTRSAAKRLCELTWDLHQRLMPVLAAMREGRLDQPRAGVFSSWTEGLSPEHTAAVLWELLATAAQLTTGELIDAIAKLAIALDPAWVRRRYERALKGRRVVGKRNPDGTANLTGHDLPFDEVAAACARLDALAHAAKTAGHPDRLDHLRADLLVGMITGRYTAMTDQQILAALRTAAASHTAGPDPHHANPNGEADGEDGEGENDNADSDGDPGLDNGTDEGRPDPDDDGPDDDGPDDDGPDDDGPDDDGPDDDGPDDDGPDDDGPNDDGPNDDGPDDDGPNDDGPDDDGPNDDGPDDGGPGEGADDNGPAGDVAAERSDEKNEPDEPQVGVDGNADAPAGGEFARGADVGSDTDDRRGSDGGDRDGSDGGPPGRSPRPGLGRRGGLRLWAGLLTVMGGDQRPGELLGWGPVHAELACDLARSLPSWWCVLTGEDGAPRAVVPIRRRPPPTPGTGTTATAGRRVGECWLGVDAATLRLLTVADQAGMIEPGWSRVLAEITTSLEAAATGPPNGDPTARLPGAVLRRWIHIRDRRCSFIGCRAPAHRVDADHTIEHARGGPTVDTDLAPACRHDHLLRHEGGWTVKQTRPGHVVWTSPLGLRYERQPPMALHDLPEPRPGAVHEDDYDPDDDPDDDPDGDPIPPPWSDPQTCLEQSPEPQPPCPGPELRPGQPTIPDDEIPF